MPDREGLVTNESDQDLARLKRYRAAIYTAHCVLSDGTEDAIAKACMAVADQEQAELRDELADTRDAYVDAQAEEDRLSQVALLRRPDMDSEPADRAELRCRALDLAIRATPRNAPYKNDSGDHFDRVMEAAKRIEVFLVAPVVEMTR